MKQNPSPMVEHSRPHRRLPERTPPGRRYPLEIGTLYIPEKLAPRRQLLVFFHGGKYAPELAGAKNRMAVISVQAGSISEAYGQAFENPARFRKLVAEAESKSGVHFGRLNLGGFSAGCGAIRQLLRSPEIYRRTNAVLCIDGIHTGYTNGTPGPLDSDIDNGNLEIWVKLAKDAIAGRKRFVVTHSEIFPGTFASTTETADSILRQVGLTRRPVMKRGPMGTQQLSEARAGRFLLIGYAGNSAPDHVDQLNSLPDYLAWLR
jgi:hypothetical protein